MPQDTDLYDVFVSYARADNTDGWVEKFLDALVEEHKQFTGGRTLSYFFDRKDIANLAYWETEIFNKGLTKSRLFLAFLSPSYFASEVCRKEWKAWIDQEIARHILTAGAAPIYFVEVPGFVTKPMLSEHDVARKVAELCRLAEPHDRFEADVSPVLKEFRRRQIVTWMAQNVVQPFYNAGVVALQESDLRKILRKLAEDLDHRADEAKRAAESDNTVPLYNKQFSGRQEELLELRRMLKDDRTGVVCGIHGLGGIGKTELAFTYAHAFASVYPGGRFLLPCEYQTNLRDAALHLGDLFRDQISDEERKTPQTYFAAITACLRDRLDTLGHILLVLDNVSDPELVSQQQTDLLTSLGPKLHLLATTRLMPPAGGAWLTLGELPDDDALDLLEKHRPFASSEERDAAMKIVKRLGGFTLAIELVAAWLKVHSETTYVRLADGLGLEDLETIAGSETIALRRHHERRLSAIMAPVLSSLTPAERRVLEYAALLAPDDVPLPWLKTLVTFGTLFDTVVSPPWLKTLVTVDFPVPAFCADAADFPELGQPTRLADPWAEVCRRLERLALFTRMEEDTTSSRRVRVHRLVQDLILQKLSVAELTARQQAVQQLVEVRAAALETTTNWQEAKWELEPLEALAQVWDESNYPQSAWLLNHVGIRWYSLAEWSRSEPLYRRALSIDEQTYGPEHPHVAICLSNLAQLLQATNRLAEAETLMRRALSIDEQSYGPEHREVGIRLHNLASLLQVTNRLAEAEPLIRRALTIVEQFYGPEHPKVATALNNLAALLPATNRLAEAEPLMRRALSIDEHSYGPEHPDVARDLSNLAQLLQNTNRLAEAEPLIRRALSIDEHSYGREHPDVATDLSILASLLQDTNRLAEAEPLMRRALSIFEQSLGSGHPSTQNVQRNYDRLLEAIQKSKDAI